jgi:hypothetical protein
MPRGGKPKARLRSKRSTHSSGETVEKRGRLENLKPWKPGQSGNPSGRPRTKILRDITREIVEMVDTKKKKHRARLLIDTVFRQAEKGSLGHFKAIQGMLEEDSSQTRIALTAEGTANGEEACPTCGRKKKVSTEQLLETLRGIYGLGSKPHTIDVVEGNEKGLPPLPDSGASKELPLESASIRP